MWSGISVNTEPHQITVSRIRVDIVRKDIKNLHLGVYPPNGRVRVAAPLTVSDEAIRLAVVDKLGWIKRQQARFIIQARQSPREMVSGESHYFLGRRYRLCVVEQRGKHEVILRNHTILELHVKAGTDAGQREKILQQWYREQLKQLIPALLDKWQPLLGVVLANWGIKKMKTKWGACNIQTGRIWLNLELAKKPVQCVEYIVVHELMHLLERHHNDRFITLMDQHLPNWRLYKDELNQMPLKSERWS
ncbi:MAG: M48 family metallopeptidase [Methylococcaceae bacterium]|nr:M48 family metallopeptidase [Methylococcaceae bacterium]